MLGMTIGAGWARKKKQQLGYAIVFHVIWILYTHAGSDILTSYLVIIS